LDNLYIAAALIGIWVGSLLFANHVVSTRPHGPDWVSTQQNPEALTQGKGSDPRYQELNQSAAKDIVDASKPGPADREADTPHQAKNEDLQAQQSMAHSAIIAWVISLGGAALTVVGIVYVKRTLDATVGMLNETRKTTKAAIDSAETAQQVLKAERAWITLVKMDHALHTNPIVGGIRYPEGIGFFTIWTNSGRSPALQVGVSVDVRVVSCEDPVPVFEKVAVAENSIVGHGIPFNTGEAPVVGASLVDLMNMKSFAYLYTYVVYRDVFGETLRESELCLRIVPQGYFKDEKGQQRPRFGAIPIGHQNSAS
jgi:hypothetical protein